MRDETVTPTLMNRYKYELVNLGYSAVSDLVTRGRHGINEFYMRYNITPVIIPEFVVEENVFDLTFVWFFGFLNGNGFLFSSPEWRSPSYRMSVIAGFTIKQTRFTCNQSLMIMISGALDKLRVENLVTHYFAVNRQQDRLVLVDVGVTVENYSSIDIYLQDLMVNTNNFLFRKNIDIV